MKLLAAQIERYIPRRVPFNFVESAEILGQDDIGAGFAVGNPIIRSSPCTFRVFRSCRAFPVLMSQTYWAMAPYIEHAHTQVGEGRDTRTCTSAILRYLLVGYNFHLCHHLYPKVQLDKLPALHRHLESIGYLPGQAVIEPGLLNAFKIGALATLDFKPDGGEAARQSPIHSASR